jgi:arylsulfatase A-like enzyme
MKNLLSLLALTCCLQSTAQSPNILLIIADDLGTDILTGYNSAPLMPNTPTIDSLMNVGLTFDNAWAAPSCTPTRATIMSGKYGIKTGVLKAPGDLDTIHTSVFRQIERFTNDEYNDAVIGKWHISMPPDYNHPYDHGLNHYNGVFQSSVPDYYAWEQTTQTSQVNMTDYVTQVLTDSAIHWIGNQTAPWFLWLAHVTPHTPIQLPPANTYDLQAVGTNFRKYIAMIENLDHEMNRLFSAMTPVEKANTTVIFIGDNGSTDPFIQDHPSNHAKGTVYEGGIKVPMVVSGYGVTRQGEREGALVHVNDIYATTIELTAQNLPGGLYNSLSFDHLLNGTAGAVRDFVYSEIDDGSTNSAWAIRDSRYKLIQLKDSLQEFYDLHLDTFELNNLISTLTPYQDSIRTLLETEGLQTRAAWSCNDHIQNGDEAGIDCGGTFCEPCTFASIEETNLALKAYPNPSDGFFRVTSSRVLEEVRVFDLLGKEVYGITVNDKSIELNLSHLAKGVFILKAVGADGESMQKIVLQGN